jgi:Flp pilus assembly protein TadB
MVAVWGLGMTTREAAVLAGALGFLLLALAVMASLHERHYRGRSERIAAARTSGIEARVTCLEAILAEDRFT